MAQNEQHWSAQIQAAYEKNERPAYDVMEEAVVSLLAERKGCYDALDKMSQTFGQMAFARKNGDQAEVLRILDEMIASHVKFIPVAAAPATVQ